MSGPSVEHSLINACWGQAPALHLVTTHSFSGIWYVVFPWIKHLVVHLLLVRLCAPCVMQRRCQAQLALLPTSSDAQCLSVCLCSNLKNWLIAQNLPLTGGREPGPSDCLLTPKKALPLADQALDQASYAQVTRVMP